MQILRAHAERDVPVVTALAPVSIPVGRLACAAEEFDLHLLELATAEREIARVDLVAERLADLPDSERDAHACRVAHVLEVHENPLRRFWPQASDARVVLEGPDV